jgi:hypothetical protein
MVRTWHDTEDFAVEHRNVAAGTVRLAFGFSGADLEGSRLPSPRWGAPV